MIPEIIHQIWLGENPIPESDIQYAETLKRHNPDWILKLHSNQEIDGPWDSIDPIGDHLCQYLIDVLEERSGEHCLAAISDVYRIQVLLEQGGLYLDTDVFGVKPFGNLFRNTTLGISQEFGNRMVGNFALAATPGHPALWRYFTECHERVRNWIPSSARKWNPVGITGPLATSSAFSFYQDLTIWPFPIFSPWSQNHALPDSWESISWSPSTVAVHAFSSKWVRVNKARTSIEEAMQPTWIVPPKHQRLRGGCNSC